MNSEKISSAKSSSKKDFKIKTQKGWTNFFENKTNKVLVIFLSVILGIAVVLTGSYFALKEIYKGKILPRTTVAGINVGGLTEDEAKILVANYVTQISNQGPKINYETQSFQTNLTELGVTFNLEETVKNAFDFGRQNSVWNQIKENSQRVVKPYQISLKPQIEETKLNEYLSKVATVVEANPVNAGLVIAGGTISTTPAQNGRGLNKSELKTEIENLINNHSITGQIRLKTAVLEPDVKDGSTNEAKIQAEKYLQSAPIAVTFENSSYSADKTEIGSWIEFYAENKTLKARISNAKIDAFVANIAKKIEINKIDKEIMDGTGQVLNEGQDGRGIDRERLTLAIRERISSSEQGPGIAVGSYAIPKGEKIIYPDAQPGRFEGKYIDVNLSKQLMTLFDGQTQIAQYIVSTGKWSMPTPIGTRYIENKDPKAWSAKYGLYMPYWNSIGGGYGIHELPEWPSGYKEGENHLGTPVSHGCIRLGVGPAETVYNWASVGTPVYIHT